MNNASLKLAGLLLFISTQLLSTTQPILEFPLEASALEISPEKTPLTIQLHPTTEELVIEGDFDAYSVQVMDYKRTMVHFQKGSQPNTVINMAILPAGSYTVLVKDENNQVLGTEKIRKEYIRETFSDY